MTTDIAFDIAPRRTEPVTFAIPCYKEHEVEGEDGATQRTWVKDEEESKRSYSFDPPKMAVMMMPLIDAGDTDGIKSVKGAIDWLEAGLSKTDSDHIETRLRDSKDSLDIEDLGTLIQKINEFLAARPTS